MQQVVGAIRPEEVHPVTVEFLGRSFEERKAALREVDAFRLLARQALADSVEVFRGVDVSMMFRPSMSRISHKGNTVWVPCYAHDDAVRTPISHEAVIMDVDSRSFSAVVGVRDSEEQVRERYTVGLTNIISIVPVQQQ